MNAGTTPAPLDNGSGRGTGSAKAGKKRVYDPFYFIFEAFAGFWRNRVMSIAAVLVLTSCLIVLGSFAILLKDVDLNIERLGSLNEIVVFVDYDLSQDRVNDIADDISALDNVKYVEYVSKAEGFESMRETYADYAAISHDIENNEHNPLADSFIITYEDNGRVYELESALHSIPGVRKVNNRLDYAVKVSNFKKGMSFVFVWFFVLLFAVSVFVIFNTIRLAVQGRKAEIDIMRYIGASKTFIVAPFVIEGSLIGCLSAVAAYFAVTGIYRWILRATSGELQMIEFLPVERFSLPLLLGFLAIGVLSGVLTSIFSLRRNLNN